MFLYYGITVLASVCKTSHSDVESTEQSENGDINKWQYVKYAVTHI
jgi:hypothetical protein